MVAAHLARQQFLTGRLALGIELADALLFLVGNAGPHGAGGHEDSGEMAKAQRAHQQPRHDLVANAQQRDAIVHGMA